MVKSSSKTIQKETKITFGTGDVEELVVGMKAFLETGEVFNIKLSDKDGNTVFVTLGEDE